MLHIGLDEMGERSLRSTQPVEFTTGCAVFAESEAVSRIAEGANIDDIIAGVHRAMASKIVNRIRRLGIKGECAVAGGGANDKGLVKSIEKELGSPLLLPDHPELIGAYGAALLTPSVNESSLSARP
jgi:activator of 2-hydroxyglutaryl-CoA dehydratase